MEANLQDGYASENTKNNDDDATGEQNCQTPFLGWRELCRPEHGNGNHEKVEVAENIESKASIYDDPINSRHTQI